jgi:drug/metabolite transporter (DMT)-like permease
MTIIGAFAGLMLKKAAQATSVGALLGSIHFYSGALLYFITALMNIYALKFLDFAVVLPFTSLTYVWTMLLSFKYLGESITRKKIAGVIAITIGVILISL